MNRGFSWARFLAGTVVLLLTVAACSSSELASQADNAFKRLTESIPWSLSEQPGKAGGCSQVVDVEMCGALILRVRATDDVVLTGLPDVVRKIGFSNHVRTEGCPDCPQKPTVIGADAAGRELAITVYPELDTGGAMLDAYLVAPRS
jgi:hypothetical protein